MRANLKHALSGLDIVQVQGDLPVEVTGLTQDSRFVEDGFAFFARSGSHTDGLRFVEAAKDKGATVIVTAAELSRSLPLPAIRVSNERDSLIRLSHGIYSNPSQNLKLIGVTGTNGKTSSIHLVRSIIETTGASCGMIGTLGYHTGKRTVDAQLTTPDIDRINGLLAEMVESRCDYAVMEVSSHALDQRRVEGLSFSVAGFTNLTRDHLDYHETFERYAASKARLFEMLTENGTGVINLGDSYSRNMISATRGRVITFASKGSDADIEIEVVKTDAFGSSIRLFIEGRTIDLRTSLVGQYQAENIALAAGIAISLGFGDEEIIRGIEALKSVPGRMEGITASQPFAVLVDYSHTPDALERALLSLRNLNPERLTVVFGCGGDRDRSKRPEMGRISSEIADKVFITSDNPRTEITTRICDEIFNGVKSSHSEKTQIVVDRREAIYEAIREAVPGEIVLIAGKGAETYVEVNGIRSPFDDRIVAREALASIGWRI